jgi:hypothetical protein
MPAAAIRVANVCRRSLKRSAGKPAAAAVSLEALEEPRALERPAKRRMAEDEVVGFRTAPLRAPDLAFIDPELPVQSLMSAVRRAREERTSSV